MHVFTVPSGGYCIIPANSHALCMSHACRSRTSITLTEGNFTCLILNFRLLANYQHEKFNSIFTKNSPVNGAKCCVWVLNNTLKCRVSCFGNVRKSSEHLRESSAMFKSQRKFFRNPGAWIRKNHTHLT